MKQKGQRLIEQLSLAVKTSGNARLIYSQEYTPESCKKEKEIGCPNSTLTTCKLVVFMKFSNDSRHRLCDFGLRRGSGRAPWSNGSLKEHLFG